MSRTSRLIGSVLALENEEGEGSLDGAAVTVTSGETVVVVEPLSTEGSEGEATVEVVQAETEVGEIAEEVEVMQENVEALESMASALRADIAAGGLAPQAAAYMNAAHVALAGNHMNVGRRVLAAESFGSASSRLQMTVAAHEGVIESIKTFIKGIIEFVKKQVMKVVDFFKNIFGSKALLKKRVAALEKAVIAAGSELKDREAKLTVPASLSIAGKAPAANELTKAFGGLADVLTSTRTAEKALLDVVTQAYSGTGKLATHQGVIDQMTNVVGDKNVGTFDTGALSSMQVGEVLKHCENLLGSKAVIQTWVKKEDKEKVSVASLFSLCTLKLVDSKEKLKMADKMEIKPLASGDSLAILKGISSLLDIKESRGEEYSKAAEKANDTISKISDTAKDIDEKDDAAAKVASNIRSVASGMSGMVSAYGRGLVQVEAYCFRTAQAGANLVAASAAAYK